MYELKIELRCICITYSDALWQEAKRKCRLNNEDIKIAKELGLN